ncbi:MAG: NAD(+)/NADH kinase [Synergistaceae bacterium]|nr:NAD(+)/NADH kinase [Synergistaceae bacterium]
MKDLGMIVNLRKPESIEMARKLLRWGQENGCPFLLPYQEASFLTTAGLSDEEWRRTVKLAIVVGGDGTFLRAARYVLDFDIILHGINLGHLGFLACSRPEDAERDIEDILNDRFEVLNRRVLRCVLYRDEKPLHTIYALNDVVLSKNAIARLLHIEVRLNGRFFGVLPADGVIVSSPTGSTAYALSAGGPIIPPYMDSMVLAPLCAHTLYSRPLMAGANDRISLIPRDSTRDITLTQDGQLGYEVFPEDRIDVELAQDRFIRTAILPGYGFLDIVREKLGWGAGPLSQPGTADPVPSPGTFLPAGAGSTLRSEP